MFLRLKIQPPYGQLTKPTQQETLRPTNINFFIILTWLHKGF